MDYLVLQYLIPGTTVFTTRYCNMYYLVLQYSIPGTTIFTTRYCNIYYQVLQYLIPGTTVFTTSTATFTITFYLILINLVQFLDVL